MNARGVATLACRLLALYFTVVVLISIPWLLYSFVNVDTFSRADNTFALFVVTAGGVVANLAVGLLLWRGADRVARSLAPETTPAKLDVSFERLQETAFSVVGLVFAVAGLADLGQSVALSLSSLGGAWTEPVGAALKVALGLWLLFGGGRLATFLRGLEESRIGHDDAGRFSAGQGGVAIGGLCLRHKLEW